MSEESEWDGNEAGGCIDYPTWRNNPQYFLAMEAKATVQIALEQLTRVGTASLVGPTVHESCERRKWMKLDFT